MIPDLRTSLHAVAVDRDVVRVAGPDAITYLQGQLSHDITDLAPGEVGWTFVLQPTGKVDAWARLVRTADDEVVLDVDGGHGEALIARLRRFLLRTKADVDPLDWQVVALRGPGAEDAARGAATADLRVPAEWPGVEGFDLVGPSVEPPAGVPMATLDAYEALRIRSGIPAMGAELTDATIPAEVGQRIIDASVSFTKGCFTGQELVARIDSRGGHVPRHLRGLVLPEAAAPPAPGTAVTVDRAEVGTLTSSAPAPGGGAVALAFVKRAVEPPAEATVGGVPATVLDLPLPS